MFLITDHARERYVERFSRESNHFTHLHNCKMINCVSCRDLTYDLCELVNKDKKNWDSIIYEKILEAKEVKIFHNNAVFMDIMYSKYGYKRFNFLVNKFILFVVRDDKVVVTCMDANNPINGSMVIANFLKRPKYNKVTA